MLALLFLMSPLDISDCGCFWDFSGLKARGNCEYELETLGETPQLVGEGPFGQSRRFGMGRAFVISRENGPKLGVGGPHARFSVVAWIKREKSDYGSCQFVAGVWNEHGRRQYGMFLHLKIWDSSQQIAAHVSSHGGATPGFPYCMDAAIGKTPVSFDEWHCVAISYDGQNARAFLDGKLDERASQNGFGGNPFFLPDGLFEGDADFTVGAVARPAQVVAGAAGGFDDVGSVVANPFVGLLGGLAVYNRALDPDEMQILSDLRA